MPRVSTPSQLKVPRRRWRIAFLLGIGVLVNYFDRVNLSVAHAALITTFAISNVTFGYLSAAYNWTYALCQLPVGVVLDKFGVRRVGRISTFIWSVASFAAAVTPSLGGFFGARLLLGIGEAPTFPSNAKAIGYWFPAKERSSAAADIRRLGKIRIRDWRAADWHAVAQGRLAVEFRRYRHGQLSLFPALLPGLSRSRR